MAHVSPSVRFVYDRKHQATSYKVKGKKKGLVQLEVIYKRERKWFGTGIKLYTSQWDDHLHVVDHPDAVELNSILAEIGKKAQRIISDMSRSENEEFSIARFTALFSTDYYGNYGGTTIDEAICEIVENGISNGLRKSTIDGYRSFRKTIEKFRVIKYMRDINHETLEKFESFLRSQSLTESTVYSYMCRLAAIVNREISMHRMKHNPFDEYKINRRKAKEAKKRYLTDEEMKKIEEFTTDDKPLQKARDIFLIQRYTGLSHCDLVKLNLYTDFTKEDGKYVLRADRQKTGVGFVVVLLEPAVELLMKYGGSIPIRSISRLDTLLHTLGIVTIGRRISSHDGRHSFATWALRNGVRIEYISKILGHTNTKQTMRYANVLSEDVKDSFAILENAIDRKPVEEIIEIAACECDTYVEDDVVEDEATCDSCEYTCNATEEQYFSGSLDIERYI